MVYQRCLEFIGEPWQLPKLFQQNVRKHSESGGQSGQGMSNFCRSSFCSVALKQFNRRQFSHRTAFPQHRTKTIGVEKSRTVGVAASLASFALLLILSKSSIWSCVCSGGVGNGTANANGKRQSRTMANISTMARSRMAFRYICYMLLDTICKIIMNQKLRPESLKSECLGLVQLQFSWVARASAANAIGESTSQGMSQSKEAPVSKQKAPL